MIEGGYPQGADSNLGPPSITSQHVSQIQEVGLLFRLSQPFYILNKTPESLSEKSLTLPF